MFTSEDSGGKAAAMAGGVSLPALLRETSVRCGHELFQAYGVLLSATGPAAREAPELELLSIAGFASPVVSGFLGLSVSEAVLRRSNATCSSPSDWIAELGNQLVGRFKNRLLRAGITIHRAPPVVVVAVPATALYMRNGIEAVTLTDREGAGAVRIWLQCETGLFDDGAPLTPLDAGADPDLIAEGEMLLF